MSQDRLFYGKTTGNSLDGPESWVGLGVRESPGWGESVSHVDGDLDIMPTCWLCGVKAQKRNNGLCQQFCLSNSHSDAREFSSSP